MVKGLVEEFQPERIVLIGSYARGEATRDSDVDLVVVMRANGSKREQQLRMRVALRDVHVPKDILVVTAREWHVQRNIPGTIVWPARREGVVLYEKA